MNKRIKELAQQYACHTETMTGVETEYILDADDLQDFIDVVRQDAMEEAASICDGLNYNGIDPLGCAAAIRNRAEEQA